MALLAMRVLRMNRGVTQSDVARKIGISRSLVSLIETGRYSPLQDTQAKLADYYGCSFKELASRILTADDVRKDSTKHVTR